jgi:hypothetical protein
VCKCWRRRAHGITIDEALQCIGKLLDDSLRRSEKDLELWKTGDDDDAEIDLLIAEQRVEFSAFRKKALADIEAWILRDFSDLH